MDKQKPSDIESNTAERTSKRISERNPRRLWYIWFLGIVLSIFTLNIDENYVSDNLLRKGADWAQNWIAFNQLDLPVPTVPTPPVFYAFTELESEVLNNSTRTSSMSYILNSVQDEAASHPVSNQEISLVYMASSSYKISITNFDIDWVESVPVLETNYAEYFSLETSYEKQLQRTYTRMNNLAAMASNSGNSISWLAQAAIGPQISNGMVKYPTGNSYAKNSGISNIVTESDGGTNSRNMESFAASLNLGIALGKNIEIITGVIYSQWDGHQDAYYNSDVLKTRDILTAVETVDDDGNTWIEMHEETVSYHNYFSDTLRTSYRLSSFEIPLIFRYKFGKQKLTYFLNSGISANIGASYNAVYQSNEIGSGNIYEYKQGLNAVSLMLGAGIQYHASSNISIQLQPGFKYGIPVKGNSAYGSAVSSVGLYTGLSYYF